jgi:hypothetical protein
MCGGYTDLQPSDFRVFVEKIAANAISIPLRLVLGGDHLGPNPWLHLSASEAYRHWKRESRPSQLCPLGPARKQASISAETWHVDSTRKFLTSFDNKMRSLGLLANKRVEGIQVFDAFAHSNSENVWSIRREVGSSASRFVKQTGWQRLQAIVTKHAPS